MRDPAPALFSAAMSWSRTGAAPFASRRPTETLPSRLIRLIVGFTPGAATDIAVALPAVAVWSPWRPDAGSVYKWRALTVFPKRTSRITLVIERAIGRVFAARDIRRIRAGDLRNARPAPCHRTLISPWKLRGRLSQLPRARAQRLDTGRTVWPPPSIPIGYNPSPPHWRFAYRAHQHVVPPRAVRFMGAGRRDSCVPEDSVHSSPTRRCCAYEPIFRYQHGCWR
jgi:hypothetical protein